MMNPLADADAKRREAVEWLNALIPDLDLGVNASSAELRDRLFDGTVLCALINRRQNAASLEVQGGVFLSSEQRRDNLRRFLSAVEKLGVSGFSVDDLEEGSMDGVVECVLSLRNLLGAENGVHDSRKKLDMKENFRLDGCEVQQGEMSPVNLGRERRKSLSDARGQQVVRGFGMVEPTSALNHHAGQKFHEVFQQKQGRYSDIPAAKISEMMKSNSFDNAPTQSLLNVINGILDESIERKNGEIPHRVAFLLRKVVQEIERRISTQAEHIRNQNNLMKMREEKYQSRIRVLETLATGTNEETQIVMNYLKTTKIEKSRIEEKRKVGEQDVDRLMKEKECSDRVISDLKHELEIANERYQQHYRKLESEAFETRRQLEERIQEGQNLLAESRKRTKELEVFSETKVQHWEKKERAFQNSISFQVQLAQGLRMSSDVIKQEVLITQKRWYEEINSLGLSLRVLFDAAENYHTILAENRKLYNEVQELRGNIRVYCRIRPFLSGEGKKAEIVDYIGDNGELVIVNPSKQGKDGQRMFKFNKVYAPVASQEQVFMDIRPLIRSVLDGYNVCIFAYGQTGSGKTYTMSGPNLSSKENLGVNYRALSDLFDISRKRRSAFTYEIGVQMVEIYNEQVRDLLANDGPQKRLGIWSTSQPNGLAVPDASMHPVNSTSDVIQLMQFGQANRAMSSTALNERSSRSHSVLTVHVRGVDMKTASVSRGCLHLIDLAGSERVDRSEVTGDRLKEAQYINKSLSALGDVISALAQKSSHVPYRNSKLTQVLQSSLGGQAKTLMFVQINPNAESFLETLSTLKFAERVSGVELGAARSNKEGKDVRDLVDQVSSLKDTIALKDEEIEQLQQHRDLGIRGSNSGRPGTRSMKHSSSTPRLPSLAGTTQRGQRLLGGRVLKSSEKAASDPENCLEFSDKHSEAGSQQSMDDLRHHKEILHQPNIDGVDSSPSLPADVELLGFGDIDSEGRLSDISDGDLSIGTETSGSSSVEFSLFPDAVRTSQPTIDKMPKATSRLPKLQSQKSEQSTSSRLKLKDTLKSPNLRRTTTTTTATSRSTRTPAASPKPPKRRM